MKSTYLAAACVLSFVLGAGCAAPAEDTSSSSSNVESAPREDQGGTPCNRELGLVCADGQFDGCLEAGLTRVHVCVAESDRKGGSSCAQEDMRICEDGLVDACNESPAPSSQHICVASKGKKKAGPVSGGGSSGARGTESGCSVEVGLTCPSGSFDGCNVPGLTTGHVCVADGEVPGGSSCAMEFAKVCDTDFRDACTLAKPPARTHICVRP